MQVLVVDDASDEGSKEFSEGAFAAVVADDHLDDQGIAGDDVIQLMNLVCHLLFECGLEYNNILVFVKYDWNIEVKELNKVFVGNANLCYNKFIQKGNYL